MQPGFVRHVIIIAILALLISIPLGGFVAGILVPPPPEMRGRMGTVADIILRFFLGLVVAFFTTIYLGFPPEGGGHNNMWPYIFAVFIPMATILFVAAWFRGDFGRNLPG